jgi:ribosomal protein S3
MESVQTAEAQSLLIAENTTFFLKQRWEYRRRKNRCISERRSMSGYIP